MTNFLENLARQFLELAAISSGPSMRMGLRQEADEVEELWDERARQEELCDEAGRDGRNSSMKRARQEELWDEAGRTLG